MNTTVERIEQIADYYNVKIGTLEKNIGASKGVLSRAIAQRTDIQTKWIERIVENYPDIDANWLITGQGEMFKQNVPKPNTSAPSGLAENQRTFANIHENIGISNDKNMTSLIRILENTIVEKDKQIEKLLDIIKKGNVQ